MDTLPPPSSLTPVIAIHLTAMLAALLLGPFALWARLGGLQRPRLHRAAGYAWVTMMMLASLSALFIRDYRLPNIAGYTAIHLLIAPTLVSLVLAFVFLARGQIQAHKRTMQWLYVSACLITGIFTLLPGRFLGQLVWHDWLKLI
jgi:uncharacterized membrane protein